MTAWNDSDIMVWVASLAIWYGVLGVYILWVSKPELEMSARELLRELEQKLCKAEGPSRELDEAVLHTLEIEHSCRYHSLNYTDSIDKTVGLVKELTLQADGEYADWILSKVNSGLTISARIGQQAEESFGETPALALLVALVRLLIEEEP